jgi:hypothetical protein
MCIIIVVNVILFIDLDMASTKTYGPVTECVNFVLNYKAIPIFQTNYENNSRLIFR